MYDVSSISIIVIQGMSVFRFRFGEWVFVQSDLRQQLQLLHVYA